MASNDIVREVEDQIMRNSIVSHEEILSSLSRGEHITPGWMTARRVADDLVISTSTASRYLADLVERGWATTNTMISRAYDRRGTTIRFYEITDRGREAHDNDEGW